MRSKWFRWVFTYVTNRSSIVIVSRPQDGEMEAYLGVRVATLRRFFALCDDCAVRSVKSVRKNGEFFARNGIFSASFGESFANDGLTVTTHGDFFTRCGVPFANDGRFLKTLPSNGVRLRCFCNPFSVQIWSEKGLNFVQDGRAGPSVEHLAAFGLKVQGA